MKLTGSKSFLLGIALIMSFVGALGAGVMLGTGLNWWLFAVFVAMALFGTVGASKILKPVPDVGIIIKYNFPKDAGFYQKGKRKTTPVNDNDILYHLMMFLPFIQIGMFVFAAALFSCVGHDVPQRVRSISFDGGQAELVIVDQGAFGSYADLRIYNSERNILRVYLLEQKILHPLLTVSKVMMSMSVIVNSLAVTPFFPTIGLC